MCMVYVLRVKIMHTHIHVFVCVWRSEITFKYHSSGDIYFLFWDKVSHWTETHPLGRLDVQSPKDLSESILSVLELQIHATAVLLCVCPEDGMRILVLARWPIDPPKFNNHFCSEEYHRKWEKGELLPCMSALTGSCICLYLKEAEKKIYNCFLKQML